MNGLKVHQLLFKRQNFRLDLSLSLPKGSKTLLVGASGAGKSTLLSLIAGFLFPQRGLIQWENQDITNLPPQKRPLTLLFQEHNLFPHLSVKDNVALGLNPSLKLTSLEQNLLFTMLEKVGIASLEKKYSHEISGGERQRTALARTLLRKTPLLLLDEPFGSLGPGLRKEMMALLNSLSKEFNLTLLLTTHQPEEALNFADYMIFLEEGEILDQGAPSFLLKNPAHPHVRTYLGLIDK